MEAIHYLVFDSTTNTAVIVFQILGQSGYAGQTQMTGDTFQSDYHTDYK